MNFKTIKKVYALSPDSIDAVSEDIHHFLTELKVRDKNIIQTRITMETLLLAFMDEFGEDKSFTYIKSSFFSKPYITVSVEGEPFNPIKKEDEDAFGNWTSTMFQNADFSPAYTFDRGINSVTVQFSKKSINPIIKLIAAIAAALLVSLLSSLLPQETVTYIKENVLTSLYSAFLGIMKTVEMPLVFFSVSCGIIGIGDSTVFGKIGRKMVLRFVTIILFFTTISGIIFSMLFTRFTDETESFVSVKTGMDMLLGIIPQNLVEPLISGNTMQVVLIAIIIGISVVVLGPKVKTVSNIINEGNRIIVYITGLICKLMPLFIFVVMLNMIWSGNVHLFLNMWKPTVSYIVVLIILCGLMILTVSSKERVRAKVLIKKMLPTFLIGFGTASSVAANGECSESLYKNMGLNKRFVEFGQPAGGVVFMPSTAINFIMCATYMASYYKVKVSLLWFFIAVIICSFVAIATPPVPGGAVAAYTVIFSQLGIPSEAVAIVIALDILFDFIATGFDGTFLQLELIRQADENKMLNYDVLRS